MTATSYIVLFRMDRADKQQAIETHLKSSIYDESWRFAEGVMVVQTHLPLSELMDNVRETLLDLGAPLGAHDLFYAGPMTRPYIAHLPPSGMQWLEENLPHTFGAGERY
jgi:hypothetical protein